MSSENRPSISNYDRLAGALDNLPDTIRVKPSTQSFVVPLVGAEQTFIVRTIRQKDKGDYIFLQAVSAEETIRICLPPQVASTIARQREALNSQSRSRAAKQVAKDRMDRGEKPAFLKHGGSRKKASKKR